MFSSAGESSEKVMTKKSYISRLRFGSSIAVVSRKVRFRDKQVICVLQKHSVLPKLRYPIVQLHYRYDFAKSQSLPLNKHAVRCNPGFICLLRLFIVSTVLYCIKVYSTTQMNPIFRSLQLGKRHSIEIFFWNSSFSLFRRKEYEMLIA